ncbi:MAG: peptidoglycan-binding protein, partial [Nannocystaceae bacterium]
MSPHDEPSQATDPLRIHADTLVYTREGLSTREDIPLVVGRHNPVVIVRPQPVEIVADARGSFLEGESFPLCAALRLPWLYGSPSSPFAHALGEDPAPQGIMQVYGHADPAGSEHDNKVLSERRAQVGRALLLGDVDGFSAIANEESWGEEHVQAMLRTLGCDPGSIDGVVGPLTIAAVELFQSRYLEGDFHRHERAPDPRMPQLVPDGKLGPATRAAIFEAFVVAHSPHLPHEVLHASHPAHGCSHYNLISRDDQSSNRRLSLVVHHSAPEHSEHAPCTHGDEQACAVVDDAQYRCLWFREHVTERPADAPRFYDPRWLAMGKGRYLLSALTTVPEGEAVEFQVYEGPAHWSSDVAALSAPVGSTLAGRSHLGVVHALWQAPEAWLPSPDGEIEIEGTPVFRVMHGPSGAFRHAPWPATGTIRVLIAGFDPRQPVPSDRPEVYRLRAHSGLYEEHLPVTQATQSSLHHLVLEFTEVPADSRYSLKVDPHGAGTFGVSL